MDLIPPGPATLVISVSNPAKTKQAILFIKGGDATSDDSYQISVKAAGDKLDEVEVGNAFTCDDNHGAARADSNTIKLTWLTNDKLQIKYEKHVRTFIQEKEVEGIKVSYLIY